jgi:endonuclease YncB( thermonuclease family)
MSRFVKTSIARNSGFICAVTRLLLLLPLCLGALPCASLARADDACSTSSAFDSASHSRVAAVNERLELALEDGQKLKIAGIDPPRPTPEDPDLDTTSSGKLAAWLTGREILFRPLGQRLDRWGRVPAEVFAPSAEAGSAFLPVAQAILEAGLARFAPDAGVRHCRDVLLKAEAGARAAALGLWTDPYYAIMAAADHESFAEKAGTFVIVEGHVSGVDTGGFRATLSFGPRRGQDFSVTILQRNIKIFNAAGFNLASFAGQIIRVRGLLDTRFGPQIEISSPDEVEIVTTGQGEAASNLATRRR